MAQITQRRSGLATTTATGGGQRRPRNVGGDYARLAGTGPGSRIVRQPEDTGPAGVLATPDPVVLTLTVPVPVVRVGIRITPTPVVLTLDVPVPTVRAGRLVSPDPVVLAFNIPVPTVRAGRRVSPDPVILVFAVPVPVVTAGSGGTSVLATPDPVVLTFLVPIPTVTAAGLFPGGGGGILLKAAFDAPVVAEALMENLVREYGPVLGREVYFAMEREAKGPFAPGNKYDVAARPPQPVVVRHRPPPPPQAPAVRRDEEALKRFVTQAVTKMGWREPKDD